MSQLIIRPVTDRAGRNSFVDLPWSIYAGDPAWRPPLKSEVHGLIGGRKTNPWFEHAEAAFWLAMRDGKPVGRISAQVCQLVQERMGPGAGRGTGQWGMFECIDNQSVADALFAAAENWLRARGMSRALGPFSLSVWDEPALLIDGFEHPAVVMTPHNKAYYPRLVEAAGYAGIKDLYAYDLDIMPGFPEKVLRFVEAGDRNPRIRIRKVDLKRFDEEAATLLGILNDAWSENWGYVPLTPAEIAHAGKKLKPIIFADLVRICEYDGEPAAFMMTIPDVNELTRDLNGRLFPFGWAKLLLRLRKPYTKYLRVPLMGVLKKHQRGRQGGLMALMLIEHIRRDAVGVYGTRGELSWILEDNVTMRNMLESIGCTIYKTYRIYEKTF